MHRRSYLRGLAGGLAAVTGCLGRAPAARDESVPWTDPAADTPTIVPFEELSSEAQRELEAALENGSHTEERYEDLAIVDEASLVEYRGQPYSLSVSHGDPGGNYTLRAEPWAPRTTVPPSNVVRFDELSAPAREEVLAAIEQGEYRSCDPLALGDEVDLRPFPYVAHRGTLYVAVSQDRTAEDRSDCETVHVLQMRPLR